MTVSKRKKICLVTDWYPTDDNPYQGVFFKEQAIVLCDYYDFIVLHPPKRSYSRYKEKAELILEKKEYNITEYSSYICSSGIHRRIRKIIDKETDYDSFLFSKICEQLEQEKIDIFYTISGQSEGAITKKFAEYFHKPYVVSEHGPIPWVGTILTDDNKTAFEKANLFLAISNDKIRQVLMQGVNLSNIWYVGNMVNDEKFINTDSGNIVKTFITVGANSFYKNYRMLIDTFNRLTEITEVSFKLLIVGFKANKGYSQDSEELEKQLRESKFSKYIELIPSVPHDKMPSLYAKADAFVMTSIQEGQPVSALEAGCCGLPIFATKCGGIEDYVDDDIGRLVDLLDSNTLAIYLKEYLENDIFFDSGVIREKIKEKFGKDAFIKNMVNAFESIS